MKTTLLILLALALAPICSHAQQDPDPALKIHITWITSVDHGFAYVSVWNTGTTSKAFAPKIPVTYANPNPPKAAGDAGKPQEDSGYIEGSIELSGNAGQNAAPLPAPLSADPGRDLPVRVEPGKSRGIKLTLADDFTAAAKTSDTITYRAKFHGKLLAETTYNNKGLLVRSYDPIRRFITTYTYDDTGKRNGQDVTLADDPAWRASLAAEEKDLLARMKDAGNDQHARDEVLHDMIIFYTAKSLEYDKAANLQFAITNPVEVYNLKLFLALHCKTYEEKNKKLEELIQLFPDKKKYTENLMSK